MSVFLSMTNITKGKPKGLEGETLGPAWDLVASIRQVQSTSGRKDSVSCFHSLFFDSTTILEN